MNKRTPLHLILIVTFLLTAVLSAAQHIVPAGNGFLYTDSLYSKIYYGDGRQTEVLISSPGAGRFFSYSQNDRMIGFKHRQNPGGLEAPALYHMSSGQVELLHEPVSCAGQVSFSQAGMIGFTIDNMLHVKEETGTVRTYDLGSYANIAPLSPDGKFVVYNDDRDQLWLLDLDSEEKEKITDSKYAHVFPRWSPDSRYISYASLDGTLKIYDRNEKATLFLGKGAGLIWAPSANEFTYLKVEEYEDGSAIKTDVIVSDINMRVLAQTQSDKLEEKYPFYLNDSEIGYFTDNGELTMIDQNSMKKARSSDLEFPVYPQTYAREISSEDTWLDVPYVHQVYDTPGQRGYSSCAPTTAAMVLAYYGLIPKWPFVSGFGNRNNYGAYVHERYYYHDNYFNLTYTDCNSSQSYCYTCYGGMGYMWTGGSPNSRMAGYYNKHGVTTQQTWNTSWATVSAEIDKQQPYSICNFLSGSGHLIVGLGRASNDQRTVIANDPYGNRNESIWPNRNGAVVRYDWPGYNHGHASLNYANSGYTTMPWCIATDYTAPALVDSIVDDKQFKDGFYMKAEGNTVPMRYYRSTRSGYGGHHWWTYTEETAEDICYVTWTPQVEDGYYEINAYIPSTSTATSAIYRIKHASGDTSIVIDQSSYSESWVFLGKYMMNNDGNNYVYLGDSTGVSGEKLAFDAVSWTPTINSKLDFISEYKDGYTGYEIDFYVTSNYTKDNYNYYWDFGDGNYAIGDSVSHKYTELGNYTVSLQAKARNIVVSEIKIDYINISENTFNNNEIELIYPDSLGSVDTSLPTLTWKSSFETYTVYLNDIPVFDIADSIGVTSGSWFVIEEDLQENKTYYWKLSSDAGNSSRIWAFHINTINSLPGSFDLVSPGPDFVSDTLRPGFSWTEAKDLDPGDEALTYKLFIGADEEHMTCYYQGLETSYQLTSDLEENGKYLWYVQAVDQSQAFTRSISARNIGINSYNEVPPAPVQIAPNHNSYQTTRYPHLEWSTVQDPDPGDSVHYEVFYWYTGKDKVYVINTSETFHDERRFNDQKEYFWTVAAVDMAGEYAYSDTLTMYFDTQLDIENIPERFVLNDNYPNPFNPVTCISYGIPVSGNVSIMLYDLNGRQISELVEGYHQAGMYELNFNASKIASGVYIYKMTAGDFQESKKMLLLK